MKTEAQKKAQKRYDQKDRERRNYLTKRSVARNFIKKLATAEDVAELEGLLDERKKALNL